MKRTFLLILMLVAVGMGGVSPALAQTNETNESTNSAADELADAENVTDLQVDRSDNALIELGLNARILGYEFGNGIVTVEIEADRRTTVVISDGLAGIGESGAVEVPQQRHTMRPGIDTISMPVTTFQEGSAVGVSADGATVRLSSEMDIDDNPLRYFGGESGLFSGIGLTLLMSVLGAVYVVWTEDSGVVEA